MSKWFRDQRLTWIGEQVETAGRINLGDIQSKFNVSRATASTDLGNFRKLNPGALTYDGTARAYVRARATSPRPP